MALEMGSIEQFYECKTILIIGCTGFLGKVLVEKILCVLPNIKRLYLIMRPSRNNKSPNQRLNQEVIESDLFKVLKEKLGNNISSFISEKVAPIFGNIASENLGIEDPELRKEMWKEIDVIINSAALTRFDERYDLAMTTNTKGVIHLLNFAKKCQKMKALLHVSTAFVSGEKKGLIPEKQIEMGETLNGTSYLDIEMEQKLIDHKLTQLQCDGATEKEITFAMRDLGLQRARQHGWPNTYTFTKAMGEMLVGHLKGTLPVTIVRPTIITSTYEEPFAGWIESIRTVDTFIVGTAKGTLKCVLGDPESTIYDFVPCDMVVNIILLALVVQANRISEKLFIYHASSSKNNHLKFKHLYNYIVSYFLRNPYQDSKGKLVKIKPVKVFKSMESFLKYTKTHFISLLKVLGVTNKIMCHILDHQYWRMKKKIDFNIRLAELYKPYYFCQAIYDDENIETLRILSTEEKVYSKEFNFDTSCIQWDEYFAKIHIPGVVKYLF